MIKSFCIIDDNAIDVYQVSRVVKKSGLVEKFYSFVDGQEALDHFINLEDSQKKFDGYFPPNVILLDINMPRLDGFEFLEQYSKLPNEVKGGLLIMMFTSSDQQKDKQRASQFPEVKDFLIKPFNEKQLDKIVKLSESE